MPEATAVASVSRECVSTAASVDSAIRPSVVWGCIIRCPPSLRQGSDPKRPGYRFVFLPGAGFGLVLGWRWEARGEWVFANAKATEKSAHLQSGPR